MNNTVLVVEKDMALKSCSLTAQGPFDPWDGAGPHIHRFDPPSSFLEFLFALSCCTTDIDTDSLNKYHGRGAYGTQIYSIKFTVL